MKFALVNPNWDFTGSVYFGCREPHFPLELGYSRRILESLGHESLIIDAWMEGLGPQEISLRLEGFRPDWTVVLTAPGYLFWRCPPPELRSPIGVVDAIRGMAGRIAIAGPHGSVTPGAILKKLSPDAVIMGEPEEVIPYLADFKRGVNIPGICGTDQSGKLKTAFPHASKMSGLPAIHWEDKLVAKSQHHHHRFDGKGEGLPGAEIEASRGCPFSCTFCAKGAYRNSFRKRPFETVLAEMDRLISQGARYFYFIDEIFMPDEALLEAIAGRNIAFGVQTRIDLWKPRELELLGRAGCVSVEAGVESVTEKGREAMEKMCRLSTEELFVLLISAKKHIDFVQATLLDSGVDSEAETRRWRKKMFEAGIWANSPVPLFPYPGSKEYEKRWGRPDDDAWERAADWYIDANIRFSDIQEKKPARIRDLERR